MAVQLERGTLSQISRDLALERPIFLGRIKARLIDDFNQGLYQSIFSGVYNQPGLQVLFMGNVAVYCDKIANSDLLGEETKKKAKESTLVAVEKTLTRLADLWSSSPEERSTEFSPEQYLSAILTLRSRYVFDRSELIRNCLREKPEIWDSAVSFMDRILSGRERFSLNRQRAEGLLFMFNEITTPFSPEEGALSDSFERIRELLASSLPQRTKNTQI